MSYDLQGQGQSVTRSIIIKVPTKLKEEKVDGLFFAVHYHLLSNPETTGIQYSARQECEQWFNLTL